MRVVCRRAFRIALDESRHHFKAAFSIAHPVHGRRQVLVADGKSAAAAHQVLVLLDGLGKALEVKVNQTEVVPAPLMPGIEVGALLVRLDGAAGRDL